MNTTSLRAFEKAFLHHRWDKSLNQDGTFLGELAQNRSWDKIVWAFLEGPVEFVWGYIDLLPGNVFLENSYVLCRRLLEQGSAEYTKKALMCASKAHNIGPGRLLFNLGTQCVEDDHVAVFDFVIKWIGGDKNTQESSLGQLQNDFIDVALEHRSVKVLDHLVKTNTKACQWYDKALKCLNTKNAWGLKKAMTLWQEDEGANTWTDTQWVDFYSRWLRCHDQKCWATLKEFGFMERLPCDTHTLVAIGNETSQIVFSDHKDLSFKIILECVALWEERGVAWTTPFIGGLSDTPVALKEFLDRQPQYVPEALKTIGRYFAYKNSKNIPCLMQAWERERLKEAVSSSSELKPCPPSKKM